MGNYAEDIINEVIKIYLTFKQGLEGRPDSVIVARVYLPSGAEMLCEFMRPAGDELLLIEGWNTEQNHMVAFANARSVLITLTVEPKSKGLIGFRGNKNAE